MRREISLVVDVMLPEALLPQRALASCHMAWAPRTRLDPTREPRLDEAPSRGVIRVLLGHPPDAVQMVRQHHPCLDAERPFGAGVADGLAQPLHFRDQQVRSALGQRDREEDRDAGAARRM